MTKAIFIKSTGSGSKGRFGTHAGWAAALAGVALWVTGVAGCSSTEEGPPSGGGSLKSLAGFCKEWGTAACNSDVVDACDATEDDCIDAQSQFCISLFPSTHYDSTYAKDCVAAVKDAYEDAELDAAELLIVLHATAPCDQLIEGTTPAGGDCNLSTDCNTVEGYRCVAKDGQGTCQIPVVVEGGASCKAAGAVCEEGQYCNGKNCIARSEKGDECGTDDECEETLRCDTTSGAGGAGAETTGECVSRRADKAQCYADSDCQSHICAIALGATEGKCLSAVQLGTFSELCEDLQ